MKWRERLIGAFVTLVVSVLAGIILYYATTAQKRDDLVYQVEPAIAYTSESARLAICTVQFGNLGAVAAPHVRGTISFRAPVKDVSAVLSNGNIGELQLDRTKPAAVSFAYPSLLPQETIRITVLLDEAADSEPAISFRSDTGLARRASATNTQGQKPTFVSFVRQHVEAIIGALIAIQAVFLVVFQSTRRLINSYPAVPNNVGFVLLHQGLSDRAVTIFEKAIADGSADAPLLANYAFALARQGRFEEAARYIDAARFFSRQNKWDLGLVDFNEALCLILRGKQEDVGRKLKSASRLCRDVPTFIVFSQVVRTMAAQNPEFASLISELKKPNDAST